MSYDVVKIISDEDGDAVDNPKWCLVTNDGYSPSTLCGGQVFGMGEGEAKYKEKTVDRKGVTCPSCKDIIISIQQVIL